MDLNQRLSYTLSGKGMNTVAPSVVPRPFRLINYYVHKRVIIDREINVVQLDPVCPKQLDRFASRVGGAWQYADKSERTNDIRDDRFQVEQYPQQSKGH